ncbi:MAG TPA: GntR family transcriptional regulator [Paraburkholderia sp.]|jgi:DNA-binding GntR family transcriptional regulator
MNDLSVPSLTEAATALVSPAAARESSAASAVSRAHYVYNRLRDDIFELRMLPGDRLTEGTIAERFNVSRTPAREALQRLQGDGLMQGYVRGGWEVTPIDFKRFDDLYEMRELIETFAIRKLCRRAAPPGPDVLRMLDGLDAIWQVPVDARLRDGREVAALDEAFHQTLIAAADNDELSAALQRVTDRIRIVRRLDFVYGDCIGATYAEHATILSAIRTANHDEALDCLTQHIRGSQDEVQKLTLHRLYNARTNEERNTGFRAPSKS